MMKKCTFCEKRIKDHVYLACDICGNGICKKCFNEESDTEVTQDPFGGYDNLTDDEIKWIENNYEWNLMCYDCAERIANEAMDRFRKSLRVEMTLTGSVDIPHGLESEFMEMFNEKKITNVGHIDDFFKNNQMDLSFEPYLSEEFRLGGISVKCEKEDVLSDDDEYVMHLYESEDAFLYQLVCKQYKDEMLKEKCWVAYEDEDCELDLSDAPHLFYEGNFDRITKRDADILRKYSMDCREKGRIIISNKEDYELDDEEEQEGD